MDDVSDLLERARTAIAPAPSDLGDLIERRERYRRRRTAATVLVVAVLMVALGLATFEIFALDRKPPPADEPLTGPLDVAALAPEWHADVPDAALTLGVASDDEHIYVPTETGVVAYPRGCVMPCAPSWRLDLGSADVAQGTPPEIAVDEGVLAATFGGKLTVVRTACDTDCRPLWVAGGTGRLGGPVVADGVVKVVDSTGEDRRQHVEVVAFDADCGDEGATCEPLWRGDAGFGTIVGSGFYADGVMYQQVGETLWGFAGHCGTGGETCSPDFALRSSAAGDSQASDFYRPIVTVGHVIVASGAGTVASYVEHCGTSCDAIWTATVSDYLEGDPWLAGDEVVVSTPGGDVVAMPVACADPCAPSWTVHLDGRYSIAYADADNVVVSRRFGGKPTVETVTRKGRRAHVVARLVEQEADVYGVVSDGAHVFVASDGDVSAYPIACSNPCAPSWTSPVRARGWWMLLDSERLIVVGASGNVPFIGGVIESFRATASSSASPDDVSSILNAHGVRLTVPAAWYSASYPSRGGLEPLLVTSTAPLPQGDNVLDASELAAADVVVSVSGYPDGSISDFPELTTPLTLSRDDLCAGCEAGSAASHLIWTRQFTLGGRALYMRVEFGGPPTAERLATVAAIVASMSVETPSD